MWLHSSVGRASPGIAEVTGSNAVEALIFSGFFFPIKLEILILIYCDDHSSFQNQIIILNF